MAKQLSEQQREILSELEASLAEAIKTAHQQLEDAGLSFGEDADFECLLCGCSRYRPGHLGKCKAPGCGHSTLGHRHPI